MTSPPDRQQKRQTLRRHGTLNPQPESVAHPLFQNSDFFDPDDLLQVKYEMLRQVHVDRESISEAARAFGFSRPSFYQAQSAFQQDGVGPPIQRRELFVQKGSDQIVQSVSEPR